MISSDHAIEVFKRNLGVAKMQLKDLSDQDCLLQPQFRGNCINWILGHFLLSRLSVLKMLDQKPVISEEKLEAYQYDSLPITADGDAVLKIEELLNKLDEAQESIKEGLSQVSKEDWKDKEINDQGTKLWERVEFLSWHESYHVGQLEYLRQLSGVDDKVI